MAFIPVSSLAKSHPVPGISRSPHAVERRRKAVAVEKSSKAGSKYRSLWKDKFLEVRKVYIKGSRGMRGWGITDISCYKNPNFLPVRFL